MLDFSSIGNKIHQLRTARGYSQRALADMLAVSHQAVSRWELGLAAPTLDNIAELCDLFEVSFEELLCLNREVTLNPSDIFSGHSRMFVVKQLVQGNVDFDVAANFNLFFPQERLMLLRAIREGTLQADLPTLRSKLSHDEQKLLEGKK